MLTSQALVEYAGEVPFDELPRDTIEKASHLLLDSIGCCLGAYTSEPSKKLRELYATDSTGSRAGDRRSATVFGSRSRVPLERAAFINSAMVRYLDYNDTYVSEGRACHPSDHIPALISVAESEGAGGKALVEAIVLAYEIEGLGIDTGAIFDQGYDYTTWGAFSSTVAVGTLLGLDDDQLVDALGICGASNVSLAIARRGDVSMWKGLAHPYVTHNAVQACQFAEAGITGPEAIFEGDGGFFEVISDGELAIDALGGVDGERYRIMDAHIKPFPCGYYMQTAITGAIDLAEKHDIDPRSIVSVDIETFEQPARILASPEKWSADLTRETADHSIPYTIAVALYEGDVNPSHYRDEFLEDDEIHDLMEKVSVSENESLNEFVTEQPTAVPMIVEIETIEDRYETEVAYPIGHAEKPMTSREILEKIDPMVEPFVSPEQYDTMREFCQEIGDQNSMEPLLEAIAI